MAVTSVNREVSHTISIPYANEDDVCRNEMSQSPFYMSLNGVWKFKWVKSPDLASPSFCTKSYDDGAWDDIDVPASWQVYGIRHNKDWDKPLYCNITYPFSYDKNTYSVMAERPEWFEYNKNMPNPVLTVASSMCQPTGADVMSMCASTVWDMVIICGLMVSVWDIARTLICLLNSRLPII